VVQDGETPLHNAAYNAARYGHTETVEALLAAGADVNAKDKVCTFLPPLALSPCLPRVWVCAATGRGMVVEEVVR
jgi:ankyrin repeat protein